MSFDPEEITFFAKTDARGVQVPFGIKAKDRTKHVYVIGKTGMGKSTLLENMAVQDIKNGNGLAFIDPHGATAETLLDYIPEERVKDVLYFAPFDTDHPVSFNVMEDVGPDKRHLVVSGLMSVFKKIWVDAWSARMEYILSNTLLALLEYPDSTLLGVNRMLSDKHYRRKVIDNITDPAVRSFWVDEFLNYNERYMQEAGDAIKNKIGQFTSNPLIRNIVGQPHSSFDLREIMDGRKILIANLSKGLVGESNANLLGSMLTTRLYLAAMSRADLSAEKMKSMPNFYFYVDEFQSFANATFADILSEARKYKLNLTIAHQYIEQMEEEVRNAVFGNVGTIIAFRVGPFDAEVLETVFTPRFLAADIVNLGFAQIYLSLMIDGIGSQPFSAVTLPPIVPGATSYKDMAISESRRQFAAVRAPVEETINAWHAMTFVEERPRPPAGNANSAGASKSGNGGNGNSANGKSAPRGNSTNGNGGATRSEARPSAAPERRATAHTPAARDTGGERSPATESNRPAAEAKSPAQPAVREPRDAQTPADTSRTRQRPERTERPSRERREEAAGGDRASNKSAPAPKKDLAELRNVLKTIAAPDASKKSEKNSVSTSVTKSGDEQKPPDETAPRDALKAALAAAVGMPVDTYKAAEASPQSATTANTAKPSVSKKSPPDTATAPRPPQPAQVPPLLVSENPYAEAKNRPDPLSPKALERMMRVTGSDRNPLR